MTDLDFIGIMPDMPADDDTYLDALAAQVPGAKITLISGNGQHAPEIDNPRLAAALVYAAQGLKVLPLHTPIFQNGPVSCTCKDGAQCDNIGKHPRYDKDLLPHGAHSATDDPDLIRKFWAKWPDANVGIATGRVSGIDVLDVDPKYGGDATLAELQREHGQLPEVPIQITGGGGAHYAFAYSGRIGNKVGFASGLDTRSDGGLIVVAPSKHASGNEYVWEVSAHPDDIPLATMPEWLIGLIGKAQSNTSQAAQQSAGDKIANGARNSTLTSLAGTMRRRGMTQSEIEAALIVANQERCDPSLPENEVKRIAGSVAKYSQKDGTPTEQAWRLFSMIDARTPRDPLCFIVEGLIVAASLIILYGAPGTLKSMLLADLAVCVAAGLSWLAPLPGEGGSARRVTPCAVLWCDFDNGTRRTHERFEALGRAYNVPDDIPLYYVSMPSPWLDASANDSVVRLADQIKDIGAGLVIIDNLGRISGGADLNSHEMGSVMGNLRWLAEFTGAAVALIHHQRKSTGLISRAGEALLGHTSIEAAIDLALLVERETGASLATVKSTKTRDVDVTPFGAQFSFEHKDDSKELHAARFFGVPVEDTTSDQAIERAIVEAVEQHHPINQTKLANAVKDVLPEIGTNRIRKLANRMVTKKQLTATSGANNSRLYDLPGP